jgi:hypothetical protein
MRVKIVSVTVETVAGRKNYKKAVVIYTVNGQARTQNVMDFANPSVFKTVAAWEGNPPTDEVEVEVGKNAGGFNEWRSIGAASAGGETGVPGVVAPSAQPRSGTYQAPVRDFETREERAARQVLIVKQSSLTAALKYIELKGLAPDYDRGDVLELAQEFTDWVLENEVSES